MKIYCSCCDAVQPVVIDDCCDAKTNAPFQDIVCAECRLVIASGTGIFPLQREWQGLTPSDFSLIEQLFGHKVANDCVFADIVCIIDQILKDKNT